MPALSAVEGIVREMLTSPRVSLEPVGFVDDDKMKKGAVIHGIQVLGEVAHIPELVAEYRVQEVIIAMPTAPGKVMRKIVALCEEAGVACRSMPGIYDGSCSAKHSGNSYHELLDGRMSISRYPSTVLRASPPGEDRGLVAA